MIEQNATGGTDVRPDVPLDRAAALLRVQAAVKSPGQEGKRKRAESSGTEESGAAGKRAKKAAAAGSGDDDDDVVIL